MKSQGFSKRSGIVLVLLLSLAISFCIAEVLARRALPPRNKITDVWGEIWLGEDEPNILLDRRLKPNASIIYTGWWVPLEPTTVSINSHGFRDYEYPVLKPEGVSRIIGLGESFAFGQGVEIEKAYLKVLESLLAERSGGEHGDARWQVLNLGVPGYNAAQKVALFEESGLQLSPDIVVIQIDGDDKADNSKILARHPNTVKLIKFLQDRNSGLAWLAVRILERHLFITVRSQTAPDNWSNVIEPIDTLAEMGEEHGFELVILYSSNNPINETMASFIGRKDLVTVDISAGQVGLGYDFKEEFCIHPKDCHPTPEGHRVMAQVLYEGLVDAGFV